MKTLGACLSMAVCACCLSAAGPNLVEDASFESPLPPWFAERAGTSYYAGKELVDDALDGRMVLAIQAWSVGGSRILSPPIAFAGDDAGQQTFSATAGVRSSGQAGDATVELALFDEKGRKQLASFGQLPVDGKGQWQTLSKAGVSLDGPVETCRLAIVVRGPYAGARVEVDCVGLFTGDELGSATNNSDLVVVEAEDLADGVAWKAVEHYKLWYQGTPSGMKMLAGFDRVGVEDNRPVSRTVAINVAGPHTLWFRLLRGPYLGGFTIAVRQGDAVLAQKEVAENDPEFGGTRYQWVWGSLAAELRPGQADIVLTRPERGASWVTRKLDMFVLTNSAVYEPKVEHFRPHGYMRFTNLSAGVEPFCLWIWVRRHQAPWYANPGMLTLAGLSNSYYVDRDTGKWLAPGQTTPWVRMSDYLLMHGGRNNVQLNATRKQHTTGFVSERLRGRLEFAAGDDRRVIKTVEIDQQAPRIWLTIPADFAVKPDEIRTPFDYISETEAEVAKLGPPKGKLARHLNLCALVQLEAGRDDPEVMRREIEIIKKLGFNQSYYRIAPADGAVDYYRQNGLLPRFRGGPSMWHYIQDGSQWHPLTEKMEDALAKHASDNASILKHMIRYKLMDEPGGMRYEAIVKSEPCRAQFAEWLQGKGETPETIGVATWAEVTPVLPADSKGREKLFYYTGLFRLEGFAHLAKTCVALKKKYLPDSLLTYVNYSPPNSGGSWTHRGTDLFLAQREDGMEMIWTEDWLGYSAGPQHLSHILAVCRAAGKPFNRPLGAYWVGQGTPALMRMKFYTLLAGGVTSICCYSYGPWYAGIDSWGRNFGLYGAIRDCQFEAGVIEDYLQKVKRRQADVAILYNRTSDIWLKDNNSAYRNAAYTHWALTHAGYDAEYLPEEDIEADLLRNYKALYIDGPWIRRDAAAAIADWVKQGGILMGSVGAGSRDQFDQPMDTLVNVFAARSTDLQIEQSPSRPKYEMRSGKVLDKLVPVDGAGMPATALNQLFIREQLVPEPSARTILTDSAGNPAGVVNTFGGGLAIRIAALPALSYIHEALQGEDVDAYLPRNFRPALRDFITWPARQAQAVRVASAGSPIAEIVRYDGADHAIVFVIDHEAEPTDRYAFELFDAAGFTKAFTAAGASVELTPKPNGALEITLPMNVADAIVLTR